MRELLTGIVALALASCAPVAGSMAEAEAPPAPPIKTGPGTTSYDGVPPARFQKNGFALILFVPFAEVPVACGNPPTQPGLRVMACARMTNSGVKVIILPDPCPVAGVDYYARLACHEKAHSLGAWPADHPL